MQTLRLIVMVVEDEALIRMDVVCELEKAGFEVIDAGDAQEALLVLQSRTDVAALFTDVNMPGEMDGIDLAYRARDLHPDIRVVVTSGAKRIDESTLPPGSRFVLKPYACSEVSALLAS
jgi:CheY-like chemotaxis protein